MTVKKEFRETLIQMTKDACETKDVKLLKELPELIKMNHRLGNNLSDISSVLLGEMAKLLTDQECCENEELVSVAGEIVKRISYVLCVEKEETK